MVALGNGVKVATLPVIAGSNTRDARR